MLSMPSGEVENFGRRILRGLDFKKRETAFRTLLTTAGTSGTASGRGAIWIIGSELFDNIFLLRLWKR